MRAVAGRLRRLPGTYHGRHPYAISGSLDGAAPGRRAVEHLKVGRLRAGVTEGLRPLAAFTDLRELELEWLDGLDLDPLKSLPLESLRIDNGRRLDLGPLARIKTLKSLFVMSVKECVVPREWSLTDSLTLLWLVVDDDDDAELLAQMVAAIPWSRLRALRQLAVMGDNGTPLDLAFLSQLPQLEALDLRDIQHRGPARSPLEPPFEGLPPALSRGLIEVPEPHRIREALIEHRSVADVARGALPSFRELWIEAEGAADWSIDPPDEDVEEWTTYGSLCSAAEGRDGDTEYEALAAAKRRLRAADPALLRALDFDQEADGTGISAPTREQLERALGILGLFAA